MNNLLRKAILPYIIYISMTLFSFVCWSLPNFEGKIRKGFHLPIDPSLSGVVTALSWIVVVLLTSIIGFKVGKSLKFSRNILDRDASLDSSLPLKILIFLAVVGVSYVYVRVVASLGINGIINSVTSGQANSLKYALYEDYAPGLPSLRYVAIPAASLGMYHLLRKRFVLLSMISLLLLLLVSIISSRLSIVYTIFIFLGIVSRSKIKLINPRQAIIGFAIVIHIIFGLNYSRNINFYRNMGVDNFYLAGISEIVAYGGSPFQGFLAVSMKPSDFAGLTEPETHDYTDISDELTTNSAFLELVREGDIYSAFLRIAFSSMISSFIMGISWNNQKNILVLSLGALGYCFAEIWRINLFSQGIVMTIIISIIMTAVVSVVITKLGSKSKTSNIFNVSLRQNEREQNAKGNI